MSEPPAPPGSPRPRRWRIGEAVFDPTLATVARGPETAQLDRSSLLVLQRLLAEAGAAVDKEVLLRAGWPDRTVTENSLTKAIGRLRLALGDETGERLRVVHGFGYQLVGAEALAEPAPGAVPDAAAEAVIPPRKPSLPRRALWLAGAVAALGLGFAAYKAMAAREAPTAAAASLPPSIALLPLSDQSPTQDQRYFADGLTDQLAAQLSVYAPIRVVGRDTTLPLKAKGMTPGAIGSQVKTSTVMEGSVRRDGDRIRVSVQLVDSRSGYLLWSETYDRPFKDLFGLQDEITRAILGKLRLELQPGVRTDMVGLHTKNPEAFDQYLLAHMVVKDDETGGRRVLGALRKAVELDPTFYEAWLSLADGLSWAQYPDDAGEALEGKREAMRALDRAIAIAPERGEGWLLRGDLRYCLWWEWQKAEEDLERGAQLGFRDKSEYLLRKIRLQAALGDLEGAIALARRAARLEPAQVTPLLVMAYHLTALDRFEEAERTLDQIVLIRPDNEHAHYYLGLGKLLRGRPGEAIRHFDDSAYVFRLTGQAMAWHALGNRARSDQFLELLRQRYGHIYPYNIANVHAYRGEKDQAFQWLDRACDQHDASLMYLLWDPLLRGLHGDPRFKALLKRVNLPPKPIPA